MSMNAVEVVEGWSILTPDGYVGPPEPIAGVHGIDGTALGFSDEDLGRHVLFLGGIGTGKTVAMSALINSLRATAGEDDVLVFFDTKGDYYESFFSPGDRTVSADKSSTLIGSARWNLFLELEHVPEEDLVDEVNEMAATLFEGVGDSAGGNNRFWANMAQDLFAAVVIAIVRRARVTGEGYSNLDLRSVADSWTVAQIRDAVSAHPDLQGVAQYIARDESNTTNSVLIFLQQALRQSFSASFGLEGDFSVKQFLRNKGGRALFLEFDVSKSSTLTPIYRTLLDIALKESLGRSRASGRVFVILDEFSLLPKLRHIDAALNFGRSLGLRLVVGTQNVGQIQDVYGEGLGSSILSAFGSVFAFRLFDKASREYVVGRFGKNRKLVRYDVAIRSRGMGEELLEGSVIEDWDLTGLKVGHCLAALPDRAPVAFGFKAPRTQSSKRA